MFALTEFANQRRWYQFRLRTLLIVVTILVVSLGLLRGYVDSRCQSTRAQLVIAEKLEQKGAEITWEPADPEWIRLLFGEEDFRNVVSVAWYKIPGDDPNDDLADLRHFEKLRELTLNNPGLSDGGLAHLQHLAHLEKLSLPIFSRVTPDGLRSLPNLRQLRLWIPLGGYGLTRIVLSEEFHVARFRKVLPNCDISTGSIGIWKLEQINRKRQIGHKSKAN